MWLWEQRRGFKPHRSVHVRGIINETERERVMISGTVESSVLILLLLIYLHKLGHHNSGTDVICCSVHHHALNIREKEALPNVANERNGR